MSVKVVEATIGFEPMHRGFADPYAAAPCP